MGETFDSVESRRIEKMSATMVVSDETLQDAEGTRRRIERLLAFGFGGIRSPEVKKKRKAAWWAGYNAALDDLFDGRIVLDLVDKRVLIPKVPEEVHASMGCCPDEEIEDPPRQSETGHAGEERSEG